MTTNTVIIPRDIKIQLYPFYNYMLPRVIALLMFESCGFITINLHDLRVKFRHKYIYGTMHLNYMYLSLVLIWFYGKGIIKFQIIIGIYQRQ